jgi:uncharacterized protein (TIGR02466 family)
MDFANIFPSTIGYEIDKDLTDKILPIAQKYLSDNSKLTNTWGYKNTHYGAADPIIDDNINFVYAKIKQLTHNYLVNLNIKTPENLEIKMFFSEVYGKDTHPRHLHPEALVSGLFYLTVPEDAAPIIFYDNSPHYVYTNYDLLNKSIDRKQYVINPREGMILIWNSWYEHEVPKSSSSKPRITAVFNVYSIEDNGL